MKKILLSFMILLLGFCGLAQTAKITGVVSDSEAGTTLPGVTVFIKGTTVGTVTDVEGRFSIEAEKGSILVITHIGFKSREIPVDTDSFFRIALDVEIGTLNEVVVVGYGTQQKIEVTGSIASVRGKDIQNISVPSFDAALQGRVVGAQITQSSGIPGSAVRLRVRGQSSISGNSEPLYIVDGVPITTGDLSKRDGPSSSVNGNALADINPNDIESIDVLKDAAAAAIYGARAANGVVIITTKRGKSGKTVFNAGYYTGITEVTRKLNFINSTEWLALMDEAHRNTFGFPMASDFNLQKGLTPGEIVANGYNTNWIDKIIQRGSVQEANLNASGGTEKTRFYVGGTYRNESSYFTGNNYERINARVNLDHNATEKLSFGTQTGITFTHNDNVPNVWGTVQSSALPVYPIYNEDGSYFGSTLEQGQSTGTNPVAQLENGNKTKGLRLLNNFYVNYEVAKDFVIRSEFGLDVLNSFDEIYTSFHNRFIQPRDFTDPGAPVNLPRVNAGSFEERRLTVTNWNTNNTITYNKAIGEHKLSALVGFGAQKSSKRTTGVFTSSNAGFTDNYFRNTRGGLKVFDVNVPAGIPLPVMQGYNLDVDNVYSFVSYFGRLSYVYKGKYLAGISFRTDGSSRFGPNNKYGHFPAASAGWVMSNESFVQNIAAISFLKLRASYGLTGNAEIGNFQYIDTYGSSGGYLGQSGLSAQRFANPNLHWEQNRQFDVGLDFGLFNDRITGSLGFYDKVSGDLLFVNPIQSSTGFTGVLENTDIKIRNRGLELNLSSQNTDGDVVWTTDLNISTNQNRVLSTGGLPIEAFASGLGESRLIEGYPVGQGYMMLSAGVDPADGREMFYNNEGGTEKLTIENVDYRRPVGKPFPDFFGGISNTFRYKGFELNVLFTFQYGNTIFDNEAKFQIGDVANNNQRRAVFNRWQSPENPGDGKTPGLFLSGPGSGRALNSDRFMYDASFLRLRTVSLAYNLPASIVSKIKANYVRVYVSGQNLLLFTKFPGWDPEFVNTANVGNNGQFFTPFGSNGQVSQFQQGNITFNAAQNPFPQTKTFSVGVNVGL